MDQDGYDSEMITQEDFSTSHWSYNPLVLLLTGPIGPTDWCPDDVWPIVDGFCPTNLTKVYNFIKILLGPISSFKWHTSIDFYPGCPQGGSRQLHDLPSNLWYKWYQIPHLNLSRLVL